VDILRELGATLTREIEQKKPLAPNLKAAVVSGQQALSIWGKRETRITCNRADFFGQSPIPQLDTSAIMHR
jgi:hypothetical protein